MVERIAERALCPVIDQFEPWWPSRLGVIPTAVAFQAEGVIPSAKMPAGRRSLGRLEKTRVFGMTTNNSS